MHEHDGPAASQHFHQELRGRHRVTESVQSTEHRNVFTCDLGVDHVCIAEVRNTFEQLHVNQETGKLDWDGLAFEVVRPTTWVNSDIRWISAGDPQTFHWFQNLFQQLAICEHFDFLHDMVMFAGYLVAREKVFESNFHTDFTGTADSAFTLMTPLYNMDQIPTCHLLGQIDPGRAKHGSARVKQYRYKVGEAIVFGDNFVHATEPGEAPHMMAFLCFTFGSKNMTSAAWENARSYIEKQCPLYALPSGKLHSAAEI